MNEPTWEERIAAMEANAHHKDAQYKTCSSCGQESTIVDPLFCLCQLCKKARDRAYDDYVDPAHWYHQHDPEGVCEP